MGANAVPTLPECIGRSWSTAGGEADLRVDSRFALFGEMDPSILRASRISTVLEGFGKLWRTSPIDLTPRNREALWGKSEHSQSIDTFISQTWRSSGFERYLALLLRFYWAPAIAAGLVSLLVLSIVDLWGKLPVVGPLDVERSIIPVDHLYLSPWGPVPALVALCVLFIAPSLPSREDRRVFFDAVCINQADEDLKMAGVMALGGFVATSKEMVVLWCEEYFRRAWCVFEIAIFCAFRRDCRIVFSPLFVTTTLFVGILTSFSWTLLFTVVDVLGAGVELGLPIWYLRVPCMLPLPIFIHRLRLRSVALQSLNLQIESFRLDDAECREDSDLRFIKQSIDKLYGSTEQFDTFVGTSLKEKLVASRDEFAFNYKHYFLIVSPGLSYVVQSLIGHWRSGAPLGSVALYMLVSAAWLCGVLPAIVKIVFELCNLCSRQHPNLWMNTLCTAGLSLVAALAFGSSSIYLAVARSEPALTIVLGAVVGCIAFFPWQQKND